MKKFWFVSLLGLPLLISACIQPGGPNSPTSFKMAAMGDSVTMGIQDAGLLRGFQLKCYPYLIAMQMGTASSFQQPYVESPGIGVPPYKVPLALQNGAIIATVWNPTSTQMFNWIFPKLSNLNYSQPYNNLGINGARLEALRHTTSYSDSGDNNFFFDVVLRNSTPSPYKNFGGKTSVQEAVMLKPDLILLWIGSNDILGTVLVGCGTDGSNFFHTDLATFQAEYQNLLNDLKTSGGVSRIVICKIPAYLPFVNALDGIYQASVSSLCVFDPKTFAPIDFGGGVYLPLLLQETNATHLLLTGALACVTTGQGLPGSQRPGDKSKRERSHRCHEGTWPHAE